MHWPGLSPGRGARARPAGGGVPRPQHGRRIRRFRHGTRLPGVILVGMTDPRRTVPQPAQVGEDAVDLIAPLLKATLDPASQQARRPIDSPT